MEKKTQRRGLGKPTPEIAKRLSRAGNSIEAAEELAGLVSENPKLRNEAQEVLKALFGDNRRWAGTETGDMINTYIYGDERDKEKVLGIMSQRVANGEIEEKEYSAFRRAKTAADRLGAQGLKHPEALYGNLGFGMYTGLRRGVKAGLGDFGFGTALSSEPGEAAISSLPAAMIPLKKGPRLSGTQSAMTGLAGGGMMLDRALAEKPLTSRPTVEEVAKEGTAEARPNLTPEGIKNLHQRALKLLGMDFNAVPGGPFTYNPKGVKYRYTKFFLDPEGELAYTGKRNLAEKDFEHDQFARWLGYSARRGGPGEPRALFPIDNALSDNLIRAGSHNSPTSPLLSSFNFKNTPENKRFLKGFLKRNVLPGEITLDPWEPSVGKGSFSHSVPGYQGDLERAMQWLGR